MLSIDKKTKRTPQTWRKTAIMIGLYSLIAIFLIWTLFPIYWIFLTSLKTIQQVQTMPPLFVFSPTVENYTNLFFGEAMQALKEQSYRKFQHCCFRFDNWISGCIHFGKS